MVVSGRRDSALQALSQENTLIDYIVAHAAKPDDAARTVETVVERWGRLDVLVNNAESGAILSLANAGVDQIRAIFAVNVIGPPLLATAALRHLKASGGAIVNVSSTFGHKAAPALSHYAASKTALEHLTRCWALELAPDGIRVNALAAGPTDTAFLTERMQLTAEQVEHVKDQERRRIPLGRRGTPEEVAPWIVALAATDAGWMAGQVITVDGGLNVT